jgi:hypothetical protein
MACHLCLSVALVLLLLHQDEVFEQVLVVVLVVAFVPFAVDSLYY